MKNFRLFERAAHEPTSEPDALWELFHENSKIDKYAPIAPQSAVVEHMRGTLDSLDYASRRSVALPAMALPDGPGNALGDILRRRVSERDWQFSQMSLAELGTVLNHAYGVTRDNQDTDFVQPFRAVPSGGGLYPLELFVSVRNVDGVAPGLYHYSPHRNALAEIRDGDQTFGIAPCFVQQDVILNAAALIVVTAIFSRSTFKYGNRGYRFALIEAGHLAQNASLVATALDMSVLNLGGFFDRDLDATLGFDGLTQSAVYAIALGRKVTRP
jgi:SagB-type dehydrogenase family enzyme